MSASIIDKSTVNPIINNIHKACKGDRFVETFAATCLLLQRGGTSRGMNTNTSISHGNSTVTKGLLHKGCANSKITPRQLARTLASHIQEISSLYDIPGNQSKNYRIPHPEATREELTWVSDFQTFNEDCPSHIREWLINNYQQRFNKNPQTIINPAAAQQRHHPY